MWISPPQDRSLTLPTLDQLALKSRALLTIFSHPILLQPLFCILLHIHILHVLLLLLFLWRANQYLVFFLYGILDRGFVLLQQEVVVPLWYNSCCAYLLLEYCFFKRTLNRMHLLRVIIRC